MASLQSLSQVFRSVAKKVRPTVVQITATVVSDEQPKTPKPSIDPKQLPEPFREFFEEFEGRQQQPTPQYGRGSGVIIDAEQGYILTNNHVVGGEAKGKKDNVRLSVTLDNGRTVLAQVVGQDPITDIALIKIAENDMERLSKDGVKLEPVTIGDSSKMEVGDWVLAIGAPFGLAQTVTQGIISATGRSNIGIVEGIEDFIQTDAAINPGNSGGPLLNMQGELIGINTAIATSGLSRGYMGIGFSIPTAMVRQVLPDLKAGRQVVRGYLGVQIKGLEQEPGMARTFGLQEDRGVLVEEVRPGSPASKAGLKPDDIILSVDGKRLESYGQLQSMVRATKPGKTLEMLVWRDNKEITIPVEIEATPEDFYAARNWGRNGETPEGESDASRDTEIPAVGMSVAKVTPELAKQHGLNYDETKGQIVVTKVDPLGEAAARQISVGDVILSVQGDPVKSTSALREALSAEALEAGVRIRIRSEYGTRTVLLQVSGTDNLREP
jgi:serine protease Do